MSDDTRKLIERAGEWLDALDDGSSMAASVLIEEMKAALEASLPTEDDREALIEAIASKRHWPDLGGIADAILAAGFRRSPVPPETDRNAVEAEIVWVLAGAGVESSKRRTIAGHVIRSLAEAGLLAAVPPETDEARRFNADDKATLIDTAAARIQAVWDDVGATTARTLAENVVSAQEFAWLSMHFPIQRPAPVPPTVVTEINQAMATLRYLPAENWGYGPSLDAALEHLKAALAAVPPAPPEVDEGMVLKAAKAIHARRGLTQLWSDLPVDVQAEYLRDARAALLAAVPPVTEETVTTVEELDALPVGTVVEDAFAATCIKTEGDRAVLGWHRVTSAVERGCHWHYPFVPARVLYRPVPEGDKHA